MAGTLNAYVGAYVSDRILSDRVEPFVKVYVSAWRSRFQGIRGEDVGYHGRGRFCGRGHLPPQARPGASTSQHERGGHRHG